MNASLEQLNELLEQMSEYYDIVRWACSKYMDRWWREVSTRNERRLELRRVLLGNKTPSTDFWCAVRRMMEGDGVCSGLVGSDYAVAFSDTVSSMQFKDECEKDSVFKLSAKFGEVFFDKKRALDEAMKKKLKILTDEEFRIMSPMEMERIKTGVFQ